MKKEKLNDICGYILCGIIVLMPLILIITYFTYTEKYVLPIVLIIASICLFRIRKEL